MNISTTMNKTASKGGMKSAFSSSFERYKPLFWVYSAYSLLCLILGVLLSLSLTFEPFFSLNDTLSSIYLLLSKIEPFGFAFGLLSAFVGFRKYLNPCSDNLIRSLPVKDGQLYIGDFTVGLCIFAIPATASLALQTVIGKIIEISSKNVFSSLGITYGFILNYIFAYAIAVLCFAISKGILESVITFIILNFIPSIVSSFAAFFNSAVVGMNPVDEFANSLELKTVYDIIFTAIAKTDDVTKIGYSKMMIVIFSILGLSAIIAVLSYFAFVLLRRKNKTGSKIKAIISTVAVLLLSFYCGFLVLFFKRTNITVFNALVIIPTMIIASFIVFFIAYTIIFKTIRIPLRKFTPYLAVMSALVVIGLYYFTCGFGSADYIPVANDIESVTINYKDDGYDNKLSQKKYGMFDGIKMSPYYDVDVKFPVTYTDSRSIHAIIHYHNELLNEYLEHDMVETFVDNDSSFYNDVERGSPSTRAVISYKLKNGKTVTRYYNHTGDKAVYNLNYLDVFENSVSEIEPRSETYIKSPADENVRHTIYITPIASDNKVTIFDDITDEQLKKLTRAIVDDEKAVTDEDLLSNENRDLCILQISPHEYDEDNPYFRYVFATDGSGYDLIVKTNYKNVLNFIKTELNGEKAMNDGMSGDTIKQIFIGRFYNGSMSAGYEGGGYSNFYRYYPSINYNYDYYGCERYYNTDAIKTDSDKALIDGKTVTKTAVDKLLSHARVMTNITTDGVFVLIGEDIVTPFNKQSDGYSSEVRTAYGKILLYVPENDYKEFLKTVK